VLNSMLGEIAGLGFIGLLLRLSESFFGPSFEAMSEAAFGEEEALIEAFEFMHNKFFEVATLYFLYQGWMLKRMLNTMGKRLVSIQKADADGDGDVTEAEFEAAFGARGLEDRSFGSMLLAGELGMSLGDVYLFSRRFIESHGLTKAFNPLVYLDEVGAANLIVMVELQPLVWLGMLPPLCVFESIKIRAEVPGDDVNGEAAGTYFRTPELLIATILVEVIGIAWGCYNYCKVLALKRILRPRIHKNPYTHKLQYGAPPVYDDGAIDAFLEAHDWSLMSCTRMLTHVTRSYGDVGHEQHRLFSIAGSQGPNLLMRSIKFHTWFLMAGATFCFTAVLVPDLIALSHQGLSAPDVLREFVVFGLMGGSFVLLLLVLTPATIDIFGVVTSIEGFAQKWAIAKGLEPPKAAAAAHGHH